MITCQFPDGGKGTLRHVTTTALIIKDNTVLLTKRAEKLSQGGKYCLPGGFLTREEDLIQGVKREVLEETGYQCEPKYLFYIRNDPQYSSDNQNICFFYVVEVGKQTGKPDWEVSEVKWFSIEGIPPKDQIAFDHYMVIQLYINHIQYAQSLPILHL